MLELEKFLPYRLSVLSNTISQAIARDYAERHDLTVTEWRVIAVLGRFPGIAANEVAERTAMDKVAVSRAVNRLIQARRVRRGTDGRDRRRSVLELTAAGQRVLDEVQPHAAAHEQRLLRMLDADEAQWLERILQRLNREAVRHALQAPGSAAWTPESMA